MVTDAYCMLFCYFTGTGLDESVSSFVSLAEESLRPMGDCGSCLDTVGRLTGRGASIP